VKGISSEEKLISAAQQVASSTAQLVLACKVKADRGSEKMKGLESASRSVRKATDTLIKSAKEALSEKETEEKNVNCTLSDTVVGRLKQKILLEEEAQKAAKMLEDIRARQAALNKSNYR
jgi:talin